MAWRLDGTYFENCNCDMVCPCTASGLTAPADNERCNVALMFHIDSGEIDGIDVAGLTVGMVADTPALMSEGNWRVGLLMDSAASPEQAEALQGVMSGQRGGVMAGLAPLIGEVLGMETVPIEYSDDGRRHRVRAGDLLDVEVEDFVSPLDQTGQGVKVTGVGFPADTLAAGRAVRSRVSAFGLKFENPGKNAFSAPFSWSS